MKCSIAKSDIYIFKILTAWFGALFANGYMMDGAHTFIRTSRKLRNIKTIDHTAFQENHSFSIIITVK